MPTLCEEPEPGSNVSVDIDRVLSNKDVFEGFRQRKQHFSETAVWIMGLYGITNTTKNLKKMQGIIRNVFKEHKRLNTHLEREQNRKAFDEFCTAKVRLPNNFEEKDCVETEMETVETVSETNQAGSITRAAALDIRCELEAKEVHIAKLETQLEKAKSTLSLKESDIKAKDIRLAGKDASLKRARSQRDQQTKQRAKERKMSLDSVLTHQIVDPSVTDDRCDEVELEREIDRLREENIQLREDVKVEQEAREKAEQALEESKARVIQNATVRGKEKENKNRGDRNVNAAAKGDDKKRESVIYNTDFRQLCYGLLTHQVGHAHVQPVIDLVLNYVGKEVSHKVSTTTVGRFNRERVPLSQIQITRKLYGEENLSIYSDETTKKNEKYMGYHMSDKNKQMYVLGHRDIPSKSGQDSVDVFEDILKDLDAVSEKIDFGEKLLSQIKNSMSDRASTEDKFHELLQKLKEKVMPKVYENWDKLKEDEMANMLNIQRFYCGLHSYVQMAEVTDAALVNLDLEMGEHLLSGSDPSADDTELEYVQWEEAGVNIKNDTRIKNPNESGAVRTIRTVLKAFAKGVDEKNGCSGKFKLDERVQKKLKRLT